MFLKEAALEGGLFIYIVASAQQVSPMDDGCETDRKTAGE